jgi:hypothetical protein
MAFELGDIVGFGDGILLQLVANKGSFGFGG